MTGEQLKLDGIDRINERVEETPWRVLAIEALQDLASAGFDFTAEDLTRRIGRPSHPNAVGALINAAARAGLIVRTGFRKAEREARHAGLISTWRGVA